MALLSTHLFDTCRLSNLVAGGRPAWRAARWQPAQYALDSDFCLAALPAAASGTGPAATPRQCCLRLRHACRLAARVARGGPAWRAARRERAQQAVQGSLPHPSLRAPPPLRGAATGAAAVNTAAVYVTIASLRRRSRRRRPPLAAALPCPALTQTNKHTHTYTYRHTKHTLPQPRAPRASRLTPCASRRASHALPVPRAPTPLTSRLTPPSPPSQAFLLPAARRLLLPPQAPA